MQKLHYTIYKITNLVNNKIYIGKHQTTDLNDGYLGSGKLLLRAIDKYGAENFHKEILYVFDNEDDMNAKEREIVTEEFVLQESNYNLCVGGQGGFSYINHNNLAIKHFSRKNAKKYSKKANDIIKARRTNDLSYDSWYRKRKILPNLPEGVFKGKKHTKEAKQKMSASSKGQGSGERNSQYGTRWITNGSENRKIKKTDIIPDGWYAGRRILNKRRQL